MNKKLTKAQRHIAYIIMREEAEIIYHQRVKRYNPIVGEIGFFLINGLCDLMDLIFGEDIERGFYELPESGIEYFGLVELEDKKPKFTTYLYWFPNTPSGWQQRIELLNQCIIETYE